MKGNEIDESYNERLKQFFDSLSTSEQKQMLFLGRAFAAIRLIAEQGEKEKKEKRKRDIKEPKDELAD